MCLIFAITTAAAMSPLHQVYGSTPLEPPFCKGKVVCLFLNTPNEIKYAFNKVEGVYWNHFVCVSICLCPCVWALSGQDLLNCWTSCNQKYFSLVLYSVYKQPNNLFFSFCHRLDTTRVECNIPLRKYWFCIQLTDNLKGWYHSYGYRYGYYKHQESWNK